MEPTSRLVLDFPVYGMASLANGDIALVGGGGRMKSGIPNRVTVRHFNESTAAFTPPTTSSSTLETADAPVAVVASPTSPTFYTLLGPGVKAYIHDPSSTTLSPESAFDHDILVSAHKDEQSALSLSSNAQTLAVASDAGDVRTLSLPECALLAHFKHHAKGVDNIHLSPDGMRAASTSARDKSSFLWAARTGQMLQRIHPVHSDRHKTHIRSVCFSPQDPSVLFSAESNARVGAWVAVWRDAAGQAAAPALSSLPQPSPDFRPVACAKVTADALTAMTVLGDGRIAVASAEGHVALFRWSGGTAISPIWTTETRREWLRPPTPPHFLPITAMAFSHSGTHLLTASADFTVTAWPARRTGLLKSTFKALSWLLAALALLLAILAAEDAELPQLIAHHRRPYEPHARLVRDAVRPVVVESSARLAAGAGVLRAAAEPTVKEGVAQLQPYIADFKSFAQPHVQAVQLKARELLPVAEIIGGHVRRSVDTGRTGIVRLGSVVRSARRHAGRAFENGKARSSEGAGVLLGLGSKEAGAGGEEVGTLPDPPIGSLGLGKEEDDSLLRLLGGGGEGDGVESRGDRTRRVASHLDEAQLEGAESGLQKLAEPEVDVVQERLMEAGADREATEFISPQTEVPSTREVEEPPSVNSPPELSARSMGEDVKGDQENIGVRAVSDREESLGKEPSADLPTFQGDGVVPNDDVDSSTAPSPHSRREVGVDRASQNAESNESSKHEAGSISGAYMEGEASMDSAQTELFSDDIEVAGSEASGGPRSNGLLHDSTPQPEPSIGEKSSNNLPPVYSGSITGTEGDLESSGQSSQYDSVPGENSGNGGDLREGEDRVLDGSTDSDPLSRATADLLASAGEFKPAMAVVEGHGAGSTDSSSDVTDQEPVDDARWSHADSFASRDGYVQTDTSDESTDGSTSKDAGVRRSEEKLVDSVSEKPDADGTVGTGADRQAGDEESESVILKPEVGVEGYINAGAVETAADSLYRDSGASTSGGAVVSTESSSESQRPYNRDALDSTEQKTADISVDDETISRQESSDACAEFIEADVGSAVNADLGETVQSDDLAASGPDSAPAEPGIPITAPPPPYLAASPTDEEFPFPASPESSMEAENLNAFPGKEDILGRLDEGEGPLDSESKSLDDMLSEVSDLSDAEEPPSLTAGLIEPRIAFDGVGTDEGVVLETSQPNPASDSDSSSSVSEGGLEKTEGVRPNDVEKASGIDAEDVLEREVEQSMESESGVISVELGSSLKEQAASADQSLESRDSASAPAGDVDSTSKLPIRNSVKLVDDEEVPLGGMPLPDDVHKEEGPSLTKEPGDDGPPFFEKLIEPAGARDASNFPTGDGAFVDTSNGASEQAEADVGIADGLSEVPEEVAPIPDEELEYPISLAPASQLEDIPSVRKPDESLPSSGGDADVATLEVPVAGDVASDKTSDDAGHSQDSEEFSRGGEAIGTDPAPSASKPEEIVPVNDGDTGVSTSDISVTGAVGNSDDDVQPLNSQELSMGDESIASDPVPSVSKPDEIVPINDGDADVTTSGISVAGDAPSDETSDAVVQPQDSQELSSGDESIASVPVPSVSKPDEIVLINDGDADVTTLGISTTGDVSADETSGDTAQPRVSQEFSRGGEAIGSDPGPSASKPDENVAINDGDADISNLGVAVTVGVPTDMTGDETGNPGVL